MTDELLAEAGNSDSRANFINGVEFLKREMFSQAGHCFEMAYEKTSYSDADYNKYASFCGYVRVINGDRGGLSICREVARNEHSNGDIFYNLAKSEWHFKNRKRTVDSLMRGLKVDDAHAGICELCDELSMRKRKVIGFLPRNHAINNILGKLLRKSTA